MGFFNRKKTVTAEQLGLDLALYAFEVTNQSYEDISQILGEDVNFGELLLFHHWGAQVQIGHLKLDEPITTRVLASMITEFMEEAMGATETEIKAARRHKSRAARMWEDPDAGVAVAHEKTKAHYAESSFWFGVFLSLSCPSFASGDLTEREARAGAHDDVANAAAGVLTLIVVGPQPLRVVTAHWGRGYC